MLSVWERKQKKRKSSRFKNKGKLSNRIILKKTTIITIMTYLYCHICSTWFFQREQHWLEIGVWQASLLHKVVDRTFGNSLLIVAQSNRQRSQSGDASQFGVESVSSGCNQIERAALVASRKLSVERRLCVLQSSEKRQFALDLSSVVLTLHRT